MVVYIDLPFSLLFFGLEPGLGGGEYIPIALCFRFHKGVQINAISPLSMCVLSSLLKFLLSDTIHTMQTTPCSASLSLAMSLNLL